ncbi:aspartate/glutamate racemase family protein [Halorubrum tropicale]|uniref:Aspartate racemase n=1 Tax=Halorubrum tropicale TaxID=1765655 RepID=A0A0N0UA52_9EURY|nr:aspartate/glutamate racemase family protein [Halorubrum tropicale]KOX95490.1 aspartate racemase [Halorubrum tropicale]
MTESDDLRTIGVLGGMSSESTITYYRGIDQGINDALGGHAAGDIIIRSVNFGDIERFIRTAQWEEAGKYLATAAADLEKAGAEFIVMATNTMHKVAPTIVNRISIPVIHIVDVTAAAVLESGVDTVGVLGTQTTMEESFYRDRLADHGLNVVVPDPVDRELVDEIIFKELTDGIVRESSREQYLEILDAMVSSGAEGVVLGCTEIELLIEQADRPEVPMFDTTKLHIQRAVELGFDEATEPL